MTSLSSLLYVPSRSEPDVVASTTSFLTSDQLAPSDLPITLLLQTGPLSQGAAPKNTSRSRGTDFGPFQPPVRALTLAHTACHALGLQMESGSYPRLISGSPLHTTGLSGLGSILLMLVDLDLWPFLGATTMGLWPGSPNLAHQAPQDGGKVAISPSSASTGSGRGDSPTSQPQMYVPSL